MFARHPHYPHPILAREGWLLLATVLAAAVAVLCLCGWIWSLPIWVLTGLALQFFRDPPRAVPSDAHAVLSPADGIVLKMAHAHDPYARRDALMISVLTRMLDTHSNRMAVDGIVRKVDYFPGDFARADRDDASTSNERNVVVVDTASQAAVTLVQVAGLLARRILCYVQPGQQVQRGQRYGFIRVGAGTDVRLPTLSRRCITHTCLGSRVDIYLPSTATPCVIPGDKVLASSTVLARLADTALVAPTVQPTMPLPAATASVAVPVGIADEVAIDAVAAPVAAAPTDTAAHAPSTDMADTAAESTRDGATPAQPS